MTVVPAPLDRLEFEPAPCPLCGSEQRRPWAARVVEGYPVALWRCTACTLVHAHPRLSTPSASRLFDSDRYFAGGDENLAYRDFIAGERYLVATAADRLQRIHRWIPGGRLLEIGSAAGFFLEQARVAGFDALGVERSPTMCRHGAERFGTVSHAGDFLEVTEDREAFPRSSFDVVAAFGVTSLLREPRQALTRIAELLRPGGLLAFNVFLSDSLYARLSRSRWWILTPAMSQVWNAPLLEEVLEELDLEVVARRRERPSTDLEKVLGYLDRPGLMDLARRTGLAGRVFRLPLPDCFEWMARRR